MVAYRNWSHVADSERSISGKYSLRLIAPTFVDALARHGDWGGGLRWQALMSEEGTGRNITV